MTNFPQDVIDHCEKHPGCKGCPVGTCVAPVTRYPSEVWDRWLQERIDAVRDLYRKPTANDIHSHLRGDL